MTDPRLACRFEALALALRARLGTTIWRHDIAVLQALIEPLDEGDMLRAAVAEFSSSWALDRWDGASMAEAGAQLLRAVERAGWPDAATTRRDAA